MSDVLAAWERIKATTITTAAFAVSKKDEKKLLALFDAPPKYGWIAAMPLRLRAELDADAVTPTLLELLRDPTVATEERDMLLEALSRSKEDAALDVILGVLDRGQQLERAVATKALAFSDHPRATSIAIERARAWADHVVDYAEKRSTNADELDGIRVIALLEQRAGDECRATLRAIFDRLFEIREKLPGGVQLPASVARAYITSGMRRLDPANAKKVYAAMPEARAELEQWAKAMAGVDAARGTG